jgi:hypothetical protein
MAKTETESKETAAAGILSGVELLRKKAEAIRAKREEEKKARDEAIEIRMLEGEIKLDELVAEYGELGRDIAAVFSPHTGDMVVIKRPSKAAFRLYQSNTSTGKVPLMQAMVTLADSVLVYPTREEFQAIQDHTPAMLGKVVNTASKLAGASQEDTEGK